MRSLKYLDNRPRKVEPSQTYKYVGYFFEYLFFSMFFVMIILVLLLAPEIEQTIIEWKSTW